MTIKEDEILKAACHGLFIGCLLPVLAYNVSAKRKSNVLLYGLLFGYEVFQVAHHLKDARANGKKAV